MTLTETEIVQGIGSDYEVTQTGPATRVAEGSISAEGLSEGAGWSALGG